MVSWEKKLGVREKKGKRGEKRRKIDLKRGHKLKKFHGGVFRLSECTLYIYP